MAACPECGARYADPHQSCTARFEVLLALDHSRREPWGSRHGQAFAAFALQHPSRYPRSLDQAWTALYRIYVEGESARRVFESLRGRASIPASTVPVRPEHPRAWPLVTIATLGDFAAETYPGGLDRWCRATLQAWSVTNVVVGGET